MSRPFIKRMISGILVFSMFMSLFPASAFATGDYNPYGKLPKELIINGQPFYDIYDGASDGRKDTSSQLDFYADVLTKHNLLANWAGLAYEIYRDLPGLYTQQGTAKSFESAFNGGKDSQFDLIDALVYKKNRQKTGYRGNLNSFMSSGLSVANSLKDVENRAGTMLHDTLNQYITSDNFVKHNPVDALDNDSKQMVLYSMASGIDVHTIEHQYIEYYLFGMAFYDFKLSVLIDDKPYNAAYGDLPLEEAIERQDSIPGFSYAYNTDPAKTKKSSQKNETMGETTYTQTVGESSTLTVSNSITNSSTFTFEESVTAGVNLGIKFSPVVSGGGSLQTGLTASQAISTAYGKEKSLTETIDATNQTTVPLKPHTVVDVISEGGDGTMKTSYDCPVSVSYKVVIFSMKGQVYDDNRGIQYFPAIVPQTTFQTVFGSDVDSSDAITNLYNRALVKQVGNYDSAYGNTKLAEYGTGGAYKKTLSTSLNWDSIKKGGSPTSRSWFPLGNAAEIAKNLTKARPMSVTGGEMSQKVSYSSTVVKDMEALYPLKYVSTAGDGLGYKLDVGDTVRVDTIKLSGLNYKDVEYYGFNNKHGTWSVVDANRQPLSEAVATLNTDPLSGQITLKATGPGSGYITYTIDDGYYFYHGSETPTNSKDVKAPYIAFTVNAPPKEPFNGTVEATGEIILTVGADPVYISDIETVDAAVYDNRGKEINVDVVWETKESESRGIIVDDNNMIRVTKAGTFHVRATYQDAYSDWIPVTALPAPVEVEQSELTRGDIVMLFHQMMGGEGITGNTGFKDVDFNAFGTGTYYDQGVAWALQNGIAVGYSEEYFGVADKITKEQFISILYNFAKYLGIDTDTEIAQAIHDKIEASGVSIWAKKAVAWALTKGFITEADLERMRRPIVIDEAVDIIAPVADERGLPIDSETSEDEYSPPAESADADISPEERDSPEDESSSEVGDMSAEEAEYTGNAAESDTE